MSIDKKFSDAWDSVVNTKDAPEGTFAWAKWGYELAKEIQQPDEMPEDREFKPEPLEYPLSQIVDWYNSPNAITAQRWAYFDALCRHILWLEQRPPKRELSFVDALGAAQKIVGRCPLYRKFIDGTPLSNDIAVMMAEFLVKGGKP